MTDVIQEFLAFLNASPTPFHACHGLAQTLLDAGFEDHSSGTPSSGRFATSRGLLRDGGALLAWSLPSTGAPTSLRIIGAHTDSPHLRIRPRPEMERAGCHQLGVEPYGGLLANSWLDRNLGLAGRVMCRNTYGEVQEHLFADHRPVLRIPQLAIHLDREINEKGLLLNKQVHLNPIWAIEGIGSTWGEGFAEYCAEQVGQRSEAVLTWEVSCFDTAPAQCVGRHSELITSARLDNLTSCFAATQVLATTPPSSTGLFIALSDHEEVGSVSATGAQSPLLPDLIAALCDARGIDQQARFELLERSSVCSADMAHATHPNYPERHEPQHPIRLGGGPVVKVNVNQRYATDAASAAAFILACQDREIPVQTYSHRADLACGSTIGPISAAQLGCSTVDVGLAMLGMHSISETMATSDLELLISSLQGWAIQADPRG